MAARTTRILFVGDMHLGTRPSRLPADVGDPDELGPAGAWKRTVAAALAHGVQTVALAGDVVNKRNALFEAAAALRPGLERLAAAGIETVAVAGNHDTQALPGLVRGGAPLRLLGAGGTWEEHIVGGDDLPPVRIVGWSFPREHHRQSPLTVAPPAARPGLVTFGLLHGDLDVSASRFAPVSSTALQAFGYDGWMLGHIHAPDDVPDDGRPFYLGSLTGLDPTETGVHGPLLVNVGADGRIARERLALAPLRWEAWTVSCPAAVGGADDLQEHLLHALEQRTRALDLQTGSALGVRIRLVGSTERAAAVAVAAAGLDLPPVHVDGVTVFIDKLESDLHAAVDLAELAGNDDPAGLLARRILLLENGPRSERDETLYARLLAGLRAADAETGRHAPGLPAADTEVLCRIGARAARDLLDRLLASRGPAA